MIVAALLLAQGLFAGTLDGLLKVDTSHGNETRALQPIEALFKEAGIPVQLLESAPGRGNLIARIKGTGAKKPLLLLAHIDVVPVEGQPWNTPAFQPTQKDGFLYARGVGDDKAMAAAIVTVALELARAKPPPSRDVIVALTAGEETGGLAGVRWLVEKHKELLDAEVALNEGGSLVLGADLARVESVSIGLAEKIFQSFKLVARGPGGHSSVPPTDKDPVLTLSRALVRLGEHRFAAHVHPSVREELRMAAQSQEEPMASALRHASDKLTPADEDVLAKDRTFNAWIRTTCVTTQLLGAPQDNVLPTTAEATVNCRLLPDETLDSVEAELRKLAGPGVEVTRLMDNGGGGATPAQTEGMRALKAAAVQVFGKDVQVAPAMGTGASDSRYLRQLGVLCYGLSTSPMTLDDIKQGYGAHGANERRPVKWLPAGVDYLRAAVQELTGPK